MRGQWLRIKSKLVWLALFFSILAVPVGAGWLGDSLLDMVRSITEWPIGQPYYSPMAWYAWATSAQLWPLPPEAHVRLAGAVGGLLVSGGALWCIYTNRSRLLSTDATILAPEAAANRSILIMGLSPLRGSRTVDDVCATLRRVPMETIAAPKADLDAWVAAAEKDGNTDHAQRLRAVNGVIWQQPFRMVWSLWNAPNRREPLRAILIITSKDDATLTGSNSQVEAFIEVLRDRLADAAGDGAGARLPLICNATPGGIDFEDYTDTVVTLNEVVSKAEHDFATPHGRICMDITAGQKVFSVAAAMVTMNRKLIFSYVTTQGVPRFYDARISIGAALGEG